MILTKPELESLIQIEHATPHRLLGMHPLGDDSGVVVRALWPNASAMEIFPTHEPKQPKIKLKRLHPAGLFEGVSHATKRVYAYDLMVTDHQGNHHRTRDAYSFLPRWARRISTFSGRAMSGAFTRN
jgi:1,4-alpha-glucan branching enzyme